MSTICITKILPGLLVICGVTLAVVLASGNPSHSSTLSLIQDNLRVVNMPLGEWLEILTTNVAKFVANQTLFTITLICLVIYIVRFFYQVFFVPMHFVRKPGDVGYILDGRKKHEVVNEIKRRRRAGNLPPLFPNGWIPLLASHELKKGESKYISAIGNEFAVYRGMNGEAYVVDAYCPHLGANLGVGGLVRGNCLRCPFHGWKFEGNEGKCVEIPYQEKEKPIPPQAKIKSWRVLEQNGFILVWHDAEGREPSWYPENIHENEFGKMYYHGITEHTVCGHVEDISENGADCSHLDYVHGCFMGSGADLRYMESKWWSWAFHSWGGSWEQDPDKSHLGEMTIYHAFGFFGIPFGFTKTMSKARQNGPAHVLLHFFFPFGRTTIVLGITPEEGLVQKVRQQVFATRFVPRWLAKFCLYAEYVQFERDIMVWNYKTYQNKPVLVAEDKLISKHRRWYSQFYSEKSPKFEERKETLDW